MKSEVIIKINKIGRIGQIITNIAKVLCMLVILFSLFGSYMVFKIPKDQIGASLDVAVILDVKREGFGNLIIEDALDEMDLKPDLEIFDVDLYSSMVYEENGRTKVIYETDKNRFDFTDMKYFMIPYVLGPICVFIALWIFGSFCKKLRYCETPFSDDIIKILQKLSISLIAIYLMSVLENSIAVWMMERKISFNFEIDTYMIIAFVILFFLVKIFRYGAMLQQESDETL